MRLLFRIPLVGILIGTLMCSAFASASRYRWKRPQITLSVSSSILSNTANIAAGTDVVATIDRSLAAWQQAAGISFHRVTSSDQNISPGGAQGDGLSLLTIAATPENLAMFPEGLDDAAARTRVFYDNRGFITEADIVLNPYLQFSADGTLGTFDLQSTITHEIGHLLGLNHSPVLGATMSEGQGRNGVFGLPSFAARTLAADDVAAVRSLYGPASNVEDCCGRVAGKLTLANGKPASNFTVWIEDAEDRTVLAATTTGADGSFKLGGLPIGKVEALAQNDVDEAVVTSASDLGEFNISTKAAVDITQKLDSGAADIRPEYLGLNGQLAGLPILMNTGSTYDIWIGGASLKRSGLQVGAGSNWITTQRKPSVGDFGKGISTLDFYAAVAADAPHGEYSLFVQTETGARRYLIGGLTVEKFPNLWSVATFK